MPAAKRTAPARLGGTHYAIAAVFILFWTGLGSLVVEGAAKHDFLNIYTGATLAGQGRFAELHSPDAQLAVERDHAPANVELVPFVRPSFYAALLAPLSWLGFGPAMAAWMALHSILLIALWFWGAKTFGADALILGAMFLPAALGIAHGQDGVFMMAVVAAAWGLASRGREGWAGAVLALGLAKFHLLLCAPAALLLARRWAMLRGFSAAGAGLALISVALGGWSGAVQYVALLRMKDLSRLSPSPELMVNVHSIGANLSAGSAWFSAAMVGVVLALLAAACWKAPLATLFPAMLAASLLVPPHVYAYDVTLLLPAIWISCFRSESRWVKMTAGFLAAPPIYLSTLADSPWPILTPLVLLAFLAAHAAERVAQRAPAPARESAAAA